MRKHLKEALIPPDHINTSLSAGVSEVIEVMMAKNRNDRYSNVQDLLLDLNAVRNGESPLRARKKFQVESLGKLQEGRKVIAAEPQEKVYTEDTIIHYRIMLLGLTAVCAVLIVIIFFLLTRQH